MEKATYFPGEVFTKRQEVENKLLNKNMTFIKVLNHFFLKKVWNNSVHSELPIYYYYIPSYMKPLASQSSVVTR